MTHTTALSHCLNKINYKKVRNTRFHYSYTTIEFLPNSFIQVLKKKLIKIIIKVLQTLKIKHTDYLTMLNCS